MNKYLEKIALTQSQSKNKVKVKAKARTNRATTTKRLIPARKSSVVKQTKLISWHARTHTPNPQVVAHYKGIAEKMLNPQSEVIRSMTKTKPNKYLEKMAKNRFEEYLASKPEGTVFLDPDPKNVNKIQRAHKYVHNATLADTISQGMKEQGATSEVIKKYRDQAQSFMQKQRGDILKTPKVTVESPFKNTGDTLQKSRNNPINRAAKFEQNRLGIANFVKRSPYKAGLIGAGVGLGLGAIGYGVHKITHED